MAVKKERIFSVGWDGYYEIEDNNSVPEGGIVLHNVTHDGYNLAKEIGVIKIWVTVGDGKAIPLTLGPTDFDISDYKSFWVSSPKPPQQFSEYFPIRSVSVVYTSKNPVVEGGNKIKITHTYIFTAYSDYPAHEPSGTLKAARIFPLIKFEVPEESSLPVEKQIRAVRADYRFHFSLDTFLGISIPELFRRPGEKIEEVKRPQQAGIFKDSDTAYPLIEGTTAQDVVFRSAEKPLVAEIISEGLFDGKDKIEKKIGWDNIHWWGGQDDYHIPSAPGAFHAVHLHWRWGMVLQKKPDNIYTRVLRTLGPLKFAGKKQFKGAILGGPLVDPALLFQDVRFAVLANKNLPENIRTHSSPNFKDFIIKAKGSKPLPIKNGDDLVLYYSVEAHRKKFDLSFGGTFFIHGLFFAHEPEPGSSSETENYQRPSKPDVKKWERYPEL